jgi:hypothetical protein
MLAPLRYERARRPDEGSDDFERRIMDEAGRFGGRVSSMTQAKFDEIAAERAQRHSTRYEIRCFWCARKKKLVIFHS